MPDDQQSDADASRKASKIHAVIDRIEDNDIAVLLVGEDERAKVDWPVSLLPEGAEGGAHLRITITVDEASRSASADSVSKLANSLLKRSSSSSGNAKKNFKL